MSLSKGFRTRAHQFELTRSRVAETLVTPRCELHDSAPRTHPQRSIEIMATKRPTKKKSAAKKSTKKLIDKSGTHGPLTPEACMDRCFDRFKICARVNPKNIGECVRALGICLRKCVLVKKA